MIRISKGRARLTTSRPMAAQAHDAQRLAAQLVAEKFLLLPFAGLGRGAGLRHGARHRKHERESMFRDRDRVAARRVHDQHTRFGGGGKVDVIDTHSGAADDAQLRSSSEQLLWSL